MKRVSRWTMVTMLAGVLASALQAWAVDEAGRHAGNAGLHDWRVLIHVESPNMPLDSGKSHSRHGPADHRGQMLVATAGPPPEAIREAQELLARLGYAPGPADGVWGHSTMKAYREFLRDLGRPVSDRLTRPALQTMRRLAERRGGGAMSPRQTPRQRSESRPARRETLTYSDGGRYEGEVRDGKRARSGALTYLRSAATATRASGATARSYGRGTLHLDQWQPFRGTVGRRPEWTRRFHRCRNGERYEGEYRNDKRHGQGTVTYASGNRYSGEWRNGKRYGRGTFTWINGNRFEGRWPEWTRRFHRCRWRALRGRVPQWQVQRLGGQVLV